MKKFGPWLVVLLGLLWVLGGLQAPKSRDAFERTEFGRLPVVMNGRVQPLDSVARNALLVLRNKQSIYLTNRPPVSATEWLMEVTMRPEQADAWPVFRVDHPEVRDLVKLAQDQAMHVSYKQLEPFLAEIERQARRAQGIEAPNRSSFERAILKLDNGLGLYQQLRIMLRPEGSQDLAAEVAAYAQAIEPGLAAVKNREEGKPFSQPDFDRLLASVQRYEGMANSSRVMLVPPSDPAQGKEGWANMGLALMSAVHDKEIHPAAARYAAMVSAYRQDRAPDFNRALGELKQWVGQHAAPEAAKCKREFVYQNWRPFYHSTVLYVMVFLCAIGVWFAAGSFFYRSAGGLLWLAFALHSTGILFRMHLEGRPPVTNLYSSAVFVGWGAVLLGLILERFSRDGMGYVMAALLGFITQLIAHNLSLGGDTMEMLRAVLDTNFWLATHVVVITLGYSAGFVAGFLALLYLLRKWLDRNFPEASAAALVRVVYGTICFATLFSFVGTVLGGIWADQSWGRFWGWDPKENGALMIVLWNALILHARWDGMVGDRGLMNLAVFGNIVTAFSWFGVNMLGVGLHAYGFMDQALLWLGIFILSQLAVIAISFLPNRGARVAATSSTAR